MPVGWRPVTTKLEEQIAEEQARIAELQVKRQWRLEPPVATETMPAWQPPQMAQTVSEETGAYTPPQLPNMGKIIPNTYISPRLPTDNEIQRLTPTPVKQEAPWLKTAVEKMNAPFEWVKEHLEEPWAEAISPIFGKPSEISYEEWKAPKFVKGLLEFSMPLWWLPYFGWVAKGAGLIPKVGGSVAKGILSAEKTLNLPASLTFKAVGKVGVKIIKMPTFEKLQADVFKADRFRGLAQKLSVLPGFKTAMGTVNPSAVAHGLAQEGKVIHDGMREIADNAVNAVMPQIERHNSGKARELFGLDDMLRSTTIKPKKEGLSLVWNDIASKPDDYILTAAQKSYLDDYHNIIRQVDAHAKEMGFQIPKKTLAEGMEYVPRVWEGQKGILDTRTGWWRPLGTTAEPEKWEKITEKIFRPRVPGIAITGEKPAAFFELPRQYEFAEEALRAGAFPGAIGPNEILRIYLTGVYRRITDTVTAKALKPLGKTVKELTDVSIREAVDVAAKDYRSLRNFHNRLTIAIPYAARKKLIPQQTLDALGKSFPEYVTKFQETMALPIKERRPALTALLSEVKEARTTAWLNYTTARSARTRAYEYARRAPGRKPVMHPFAASRLFPDEIANDLNKMLTDRAMPIITKASNINALSRFMVTGFDFGAGLIQGVPLLMAHPFKWGKAMGISIGSWGSPATRTRYLSQPKNLELLEKLVPEGLIIGDSDFMEAVAQGGLISRMPELLQRYSGAQKWATSFHTFGDAARIEWAKALLPMVEREGKSLRELSAFLNEATGVMSSRALGIGATQRELEGAVLLFAPRYFRANMALWSDMMRGNLRGQLARDTLASMIMGGFFWYYGISKALGQEPNLDPTSGKFMTVRIGNENVGLGSMQIAMIRLLGNIYETATEDPTGFIKLNSRDNPLVQFARSRVAPITGASWDVVTGKTYIGEPLDDPKTIVEEVFIQRTLPFWLSGFITDYPTPGWASIPSQMAGTRTWPVQLWEKRNDLRDRLSQAEYGKLWKETNQLEQADILNKYEDLRSLTDEAAAVTLERGSVKEKQWAGFQEDRKRARSLYESKLWAAQERYDSGEIIGYQFKELAQNAGAELRGAYHNIESNPAFKDVMAFLEQPLTAEQMKNTPLEDIAFDTYMSLMYSGDLEDKSGEYNFDKAERRRQVFIAQFGEEMHQYVLDVLSTKGNIPPLMQELYRAREVLRPYWEVTDQVIRLFGQTYADSNSGQALITERRKRMRLSNREMAQVYNKFYAQNR